MHAYCLFCQTDKCDTTALVLEKYGYNRAISPKICTRKRIQGQNIEIKRDMLPGYIFVYQNEALSNVNELKRIANAYRLLGEPENAYELYGDDRDFAMRILDQNGVVSSVHIVQVGDRVIINDQLFGACKGEVTRIDRRKERARIDFVFNGSSCHTWIAYEMIQVENESK